MPMSGFLFISVLQFLQKVRIFVADGGRKMAE
jgi:hypothetical protein